MSLTKDNFTVLLILIYISYIYINATNSLHQNLMQRIIIISTVGSQSNKDYPSIFFLIPFYSSSFPSSPLYTSTPHKGWTTTQGSTPPFSSILPVEREFISQISAKSVPQINHGGGSTPYAKSIIKSLFSFKWNYIYLFTLFNYYWSGINLKFEWWFFKIYRITHCYWKWVWRLRWAHNIKKKELTMQLPIRDIVLKKLLNAA